MVKKSVLLISLLFLSFFVSTSLAEAFKLPDTGQTTCYDSSGNIISCAGTGQDGAYNINPMSFTDNGNGTVTDNHTGLIWQKEDDGQIYNWYQAIGAYDLIYNPTSQNVCGAYGAGWHLPTQKELITIVDYSIPYPGPTINTTYFPNTKSSRYWLATDWASYVSFDDGFLPGYEGNKGNYNYVRCVLGQYPAQNLIDNNDGTVTDNVTRLMWQQGEPGHMTWDSALSYCGELNLGGHSDWRLPNIKELASLTADTAFFPNIIPGSIYRSSTTYTSIAICSWVTGGGGVGYFLKGGQQDPPYVRCVRGGQSDGSSILITKYAKKSQIGSGAQAIFDITIENNGKTPLVNIEVKDDQCDELKADNKNNNNYLAIGDKLKYTCVKKYVTHDLTNIAAVKAVSINGTVVTSSATATVKVDNGFECDPSLYENICDKKGQVVTGFYILSKKESKKYDCNYGGYPAIVVIDKQIMPNGDIKCIEQGIVGDINSDCLGRCGPGCGWDLFDERYTQECLNHDLCTRSTGQYLGPCKTEIDIAQEGWTCAEECPE